MYKMTSIIVNYGKTWAIENVTASNWLPDDYAGKAVIRYTDDAGGRRIVDVLHAVRFVYGQDWETDFFIDLKTTKPLPFSIESKVYNVMSKDVATIYGLER